MLSPHLDDAVMAARWDDQSRNQLMGRTVEIWTCFTDGPAVDDHTAQPSGPWATMPPVVKKTGVPLPFLERAIGGSICTNEYGGSLPYTASTTFFIRLPTSKGSRDCRRFV